MWDKVINEDAISELVGLAKSGDPKAKEVIGIINKIDIKELDYKG